jgi:phosphoribosylformylglycinamidine synthase PurS subunit
MKYLVEINVMPHKGLLDPQGKAVTNSMRSIGLPEIENVRIGKHITFEIEAASADVAEARAREACEKLLSNRVMEYFEINVIEPE